jgi:hypothetical protein
MLAYGNCGRREAAAALVNKGNMGNMERIYIREVNQYTIHVSLIVEEFFEQR